MYVQPPRYFLLPSMKCRVVQIGCLRHVDSMHNLGLWFVSRVTLQSSETLDLGSSRVLEARADECG